MDEFEEFDGEGFYIINFEKIVSDKSFLPVTRLLAADMMMNPYITVGDFLKEITDSDLKNLLTLSEDIEEGNNAEDFILLSEMLATGEGLSFADDADEVMKRVNQFVVMLSIESLYRKGMVKIYHENMSFGEDMNNKIIAEKLDDKSDE